MIKNVFAVMPFRLENHIEVGTKLARIAEQYLNAYCPLIHLRMNNTNIMEYLSCSISGMQDAAAIIFINDWQEHTECAILHKIAETYRLPILEFEFPESQE